MNTSAFGLAGYCSTDWVSGDTTSCRLPNYAFTSKAELKTAVQAFDANPVVANATYGPIAEWDVSAITDLSYLCNGLKNFDADISNWDTSGVTSMKGMFQYTSAFNQPLSFDTSNVKDMRLMFNGAKAFNQPLSVDTSSVPSMHGMFNGASAFNQPRVRPAIIVARMFNISSSTQEAVAVSRGWTGPLRGESSQRVESRE